MTTSKTWEARRKRWDAWKTGQRTRGQRVEQWAQTLATERWQIPLSQCSKWQLEDVYADAREIVASEERSKRG